MGHAFSARAEQLEFLDKMSQDLSELKTLAGKELPCIMGWQICIKALNGLWTVLKDEGNFKFLFTARLNQDCLENMFSVIRGRGRFCDNPDNQQFKAAFKFVVADKLFLHSSGSNCKADNDTILLDVATVAVAKTVVVDTTSTKKDVLATADASNLTVPLSLPSTNVLAYIAGYLLRKVSVHECPVCFSNLCQQLPEQAEIPDSLELLRNKSLGALICPTPQMEQFVEKLEALFTSTFEWVIHMPFIVNRLCNSSEEILQMVSCEHCQDKARAMARLFMRVRVFHALKVNNLENSAKSLKRNRKMLKLAHL
jgi:hypothetical protein